MEGGRQRITLHDQMLGVGDGGELTGGGFTLNDVLTNYKSPSPAVRLNGRTLLDIIRDDVAKSPAGNRESKSWKFLTDRLRFNLAGFLSPESTSTAIVPSLRQISRRDSARFNQHIPPSPEHPPENSNSAPIEEVSTAEDTAAPMRISLMDLLEETDRQMGLEGSESRLEEEIEEDEVAAVCGGGTERNCCVCMARDKGAAFIPCGHTFCRLCSREVWVNRGNCPLCNAHILDILDIF